MKYLDKIEIISLRSVTERNAMNENTVVWSGPNAPWGRALNRQYSQAMLCLLQAGCRIRRDMQSGFVQFGYADLYLLSLCCYSVKYS